MKNFRIYVNVEGWEYITTTTNVNKIITTLDNQIDLGAKQFIVIEHENNWDNPIITTMRQYEEFKEKRLSRKA